jgi:solute carrier family 25, member 38
MAQRTESWRAALAAASAEQQQEEAARRRRRRQRQRRRPERKEEEAAESGFAPVRSRRAASKEVDQEEQEEEEEKQRQRQEQEQKMADDKRRSAAVRKPPPALASAIAGGAAGAFISACVQPLDVLRTRLQAEAALGQATRSAAAVLRGIVASEGARGLWRGTGPTVVRLSAGAALNFVALERLKAAALSRAAAARDAVEEQEQQAKAAGGGGGDKQANAGAVAGNSGKQQQHHRHHHHAPHLGVWQAAAVGGLARALSAAVMSPVTLVKTRMEYGGPGTAGAAASAARGAAAGSAAAAAAAPRYRNTFHALATIAREEGGLRGLFRGAGPTVMTNAPFSALYYLFYTRLQAALGPAANAAASERHGHHHHQGAAAAGALDSSRDSPSGVVPAFAVNFVSGVIAATAATLATQPTDVLRTRMQLGLGAGGGAASAADALGQVLRAQGPSALLTGAGPRVVKRVLQTALVWTLYEELVPRLTAAGGRAKEMLLVSPALVGSVAGAGGEDDDDDGDSSSCSDDEEGGMAPKR